MKEAGGYDEVMDILMWIAAFFFLPLMTLLEIAVLIAIVVYSVKKQTAKLTSVAAFLLTFALYVYNNGLAMITGVTF